MNTSKAERQRDFHGPEPVIERAGERSIVPGAAVPSPGKPILEAVHLKKDFSLHSVRWFRPGRVVHAAEDIALTLYPGRATALVGESGCGKTTVARLLMRLYEPTGGEIRLYGAPVTKGQRALQTYRRQVQYIFQDPFSSLNPVHNVRHHLERPLRLHGYARNAQEGCQQILALKGVRGDEAGRFARRNRG